MAEFKTEAERDRGRAVYYMSLAVAVRNNANCWGSEVGAVLVRNDRVISTGYNGTPAKFLNCREGGCVRCEEHHKRKEDPEYESPHPEVMQGKAAGHLPLRSRRAERFAERGSARHSGRRLSSLLDAPAMLLMSEGVDAGRVQQVIYMKDWYGTKDQRLRDQYDQLTQSPRFAGFAQLDEKLVRAFTGNVAPLFEDPTPSDDDSPQMGTGA